jgi:hypothetical protein
MIQPPNIYGLDNCIAVLKDNFSLVDEDPDFPNFTKFEIFKRYENILIKRSIRIRNTNIYGLFLEAEYRVPSAKHGLRTATAGYFYTLTFFGSEHGRILLRRETLHDKINEMFAKTEIDFPRSPEFSRKFYVLAERPSEAARVLDERVRDLFVKYGNDSTEAEVFGQCMVIGDKSGFNSRSILSCLTLAKEIDREFPLEGG